ncbi:A-agglutinin attachment subunit precursor, putative [Trichomonas vaginalis G3]|uniref:A-agglutinin attachment subunit, putative n=1 Tax=Trichomonas vaginalis (strain ATCC PRA-98 / G3) TaxID=412133 RepID=A2ETH5_TRIV3|nr:A-agglutinin attachment subunit precursor, putative [Trichomonas vaginalis G3]|eukprot:XP_001316244.1 A-agglutinin attachment subunit precursor [Trichomonas vaginalis G3]
MSGKFSTQSQKQTNNVGPTNICPICQQYNEREPVWKRVLDRINSEKKQDKKQDVYAALGIDKSKWEHTFSISFSSDSDFDSSDSDLSSVQSTKTEKKVTQPLETPGSSKCESVNLTSTTDSLITGSPIITKTENSTQTTNFTVSTTKSASNKDSLTFGSITTNFSKNTEATNTPLKSKTKDDEISICSSKSNSSSDFLSNSSSDLSLTD